MTTMNEETLDIVEELHAWADIIDKSKGKAQVVMLTGEVFVDAAGEIIIQRGDNEALREELQQAKLDHITTLGELQEAAAEIKRLRTAGDALATNYELMLEQDWSSFLEEFLYEWKEARRER